MRETSAHGDTKVYWKDNILYVEPSSAFNLEGVLEAAKKVRKLIDTRPVDRWARMIVFKDNSTLGPVSAVEPIVESFKYCADNGCQLVAIVGGNALNKESYTKIGEHVDLPIYFFKVLQEAEIFVQQNM